MHSPRIGLCLRGELSFFLQLLLVCQPRNQILQIVKFLGKIRLQVLNLLFSVLYTVLILWLA